MNTDYDVIVVGGGISGLACAWRLQQSGCRVLLLEASSRAGGTIGTLRRDGYLLESGPNSALDTTPLIAQLLDELDITGARVDSAPAAVNRYILHHGRLLPLPLSPLAFVSTPLFSLSAKLRLLREPFIRRAAADADESIAAFVRRRLGSEFLERAIDPFVAGVYAGNPDQLSVRAAFPKLHRLEQTYGSLIAGQLRGSRARARDPEQSRHAATMFSFRGGMQTLTDAIAQRLARIELDAPVTGVESRDDGWIVATAGPRLPRSLRTRAVVLAVPAYAAAKLVATLAPAAAEVLAAIPYPPIAVVASGYRKSAIGHALDGFGFLVPKSEGRQVLGTIFSSTLFEGRAPDGAVLLTTFVGGARQPALARRDEEQIAGLVQAEHAAILGANTSPEFVDVRRWPNAIPQYALGHLERIAAIEDAERKLPGIHFCANWRGGVSLGDCIRSAAGTAERVLSERR